MGRQRKRKDNAYELVQGTGRLSKHRRGFGFVILENKELTGGRDVYISPSNLASAMEGDRVLVHIFDDSLAEERPEGRVEKVLDRSMTRVSGTFLKERGYGYVIPEDYRKGETLLILKKDFAGARPGDKVEVEITRFPEKRRTGEGKVVEIICRRDDPQAGVKALIRAYGVPDAFPKAALQEAKKVPSRIPQTELAGRRDLRGDVIVTMDGADAKDLDDAVSVRRLENGNYQLGVHIADVSHYVKEGHFLDKEALRRGCSVYLLDLVLPMLPEALSNGVCSLNPWEDRLTLSVSMEIDERGVVVSHEIFESVIHSKERLVYTDVSDLLEYRRGRSLLAKSQFGEVQENEEGEESRELHLQELKVRYEGLLETFYLMEDLAALLRKKRRDRGSLDFDFDEAYITLNEEGIPVSVETAERRTANKIIEEFMLAANETVAEHFAKRDTPFVYRIHEAPAVDKVAELTRVLLRFGLRIPGDEREPNPGALNAILDQVKDKPEEHLVNTLMLRSMQKAYYGTGCKGHFGLGVSYYCHFTSPIRRYPDLIIHRIIKECLKGGLSGGRREALTSKTDQAADQSSAAERTAEELEREVERLKKAEFMADHLGEEFHGIISGLSPSGIFVEIRSTIEGRVALESIEDDYYVYEPEQYRFIGRRTRRVFGLGDKVNVKAESVDLQLREIRFLLLDKQ